MTQDWAVSSRMLLVGIADAHPDPESSNRNPLLDLLLTFTLGRVDLDRQLAADWDEGSNARSNAVKLSPSRHRRVTLTDLPPLRGHSGDVIQVANRLMDKIGHRPERLPLRYLFGGILLVPECGAYRSLDALIGDRVDLSAVAASSRGFLGASMTCASLISWFIVPATIAPLAGPVADDLVGQDLLGRSDSSATWPVRCRPATCDAARHWVVRDGAAARAFHGATR